MLTSIKSIANACVYGTGPITFGYPKLKDYWNSFYETFHGGEYAKYFRFRSGLAYALKWWMYRNLSFHSFDKCWHLLNAGNGNEYAQPQNCHDSQPPCRVVVAIFINNSNNKCLPLIYFPFIKFKLFGNFVQVVTHQRTNEQASNEMFLWNEIWWLSRREKDADNLMPSEGRKRDGIR